MRDLVNAPDYAGMQIVPGGVEIDLTGEPSAAVSAVLSGDQTFFDSKAIPVLIRHVARTQNQLQALADRLKSDQAAWNAQGITLTSWGPDIESNTVKLTLAHYTSDAEAALTSRYGAANISVLHQDLALSGSSNRDADTSPWWGGDFIDVAGSGCTSWFSLTSTANHIDYNATAGHCGLGNVYNSRNGTNYQGDVLAGRQNWNNGGSVDVELYPVSANEPRIWADPTTQSRLVTSRSTGDPVNTLLCTGGYTNREVCNVRIKNSDTYAAYNGKTIYHQVYCEQDNHVLAFSSGDSGGPVYAGKNGSAEAQAFGMIVATPTDATQDWKGWYTPSRNIFGVLPAGFTFTPAA